MKKSLHEEFTRFFESPSRESLRQLLKHHFGETDNLDFKEQWPDELSMVQHIVAMANSGGGCIIFGVSQKADTSFEVAGIDSIKDKVDLRNKLRRFVSNKLQYDVLDFSYIESEYPLLMGKKFQVLLVEDTPEYIPFMVEADSGNLRKGTIYVRKNTASVKVEYSELQVILNRRIATAYSSNNELILEQHLRELKALYREASGTPYENDLLAQIGGAPEELRSWSDEYDGFIHQMIYKKRKIIESIILKGEKSKENDWSEYDEY
jgi:predicted HTH transcriptional regulator